MRARTFVVYIWSFLMFVLAGFGVFYIITGQNILTGQSRGAAINNVLPASDTSEEGTNTSELDTTDDTVEKDNAEQKSKELLLFNEVMSKTSSDYSYKLEALESGDTSVVFFRFGEESGTWYVAVYGSGLDTDNEYYAYLVGQDGEEQLGKLLKVDDTDVLKLGFSGDLSSDTYSTAVITNSNEYTENEITHEAVVELDDLYQDSDTEGSSDEESANDDSESNQEEVSDQDQDGSLNTQEDSE